MYSRKIIIISGPTASGKSKIADLISKSYNGVKISADSRQVYKNLPIFSGLDEKDISSTKLVSFLDETEDISAGLFTKKANQKINNIFNIPNKNIIPVIVGGTSFYIESLIYKNSFPEVPINYNLRKRLEKKTLSSLLEELKKKDIRRYDTVDKNNKPRIIRALEIIDKIGKVPERKKEIKEYDIFYIWLDCDKSIYSDNIIKNFIYRLNSGYFKEAVKLKNRLEEKIGLKASKEKFHSLGLSYKHIYDFWEEKINKDQFINLSIKEEQKYAKRQNTYIKKLYQNLPDKVFKRKYNIGNENYIKNVENDLNLFFE